MAAPRPQMTPKYTLAPAKLVVENASGGSVPFEEDG